jgi:hypothetical protein
MRDVPGGKVNIRGALVLVVLSKNVHMYMCPIPNGFRERAVSLYNSKIVDKKEILRTVSNKTELRGFSPQANYTDRATAACRRS